MRAESELKQLWAHTVWIRYFFRRKSCQHPIARDLDNRRFFEKAIDELNKMYSASIPRIVERERRYVRRIEKTIRDSVYTKTSLQTRFARFYLRLRHLSLYKAIRHSGLWIPSGWKVFLALALYPGDTFFDVGANIGLVTQAASWLVGRQGRVHSFEPSPSVAHCLRRRTEFLGLKNVVINEFALGAEPGSATLYEYSEHHGGASSLRPATKRGYDQPSETGVKVRVLDDYIKENEVNSARMLKIDVEGSEVDVLYGSRNVINTHRPVLFVEISRETSAAFGRSVSELLRIIESLGYTMFSWRPEGLLEIHTESDIPETWHHDDAICMDMERHYSLYKRLHRLSRKPKFLLS